MILVPIDYLDDPTKCSHLQLPEINFCYIVVCCNDGIYTRTSFYKTYFVTAKLKIYLEMYYHNNILPMADCAFHKKVGQGGIFIREVMLQWKSH